MSDTEYKVKALSLSNEWWTIHDGCSLVEARRVFSRATCDTKWKSVELIGRQTPPWELCERFTNPKYSAELNQI
jgi:hypothetical protein